MSNWRRDGWIPNQHGAWAMLLIPIVVGAWLAGPNWMHLLMTLSWLSGYCALSAAGLWLKSRRRPRYRRALATWLAISAVSGAITLGWRPHLLVWAPLFIVPLAVALYASAARQERAIGSGLATATGSAAMTLVAYDIGGGTDWARAAIATVAVAAYSGGTVWYVKTMIRERGQRGYLVASVAWHLLATVAATAVSSPLAVFFALATARAWVFPRRFATLTPKHVGFVEIAFSLALVAILLAAPLTWPPG